MVDETKENQEKDSMTSHDDQELNKDNSSVSEDKNTVDENKEANSEVNDSKEQSRDEDDELNTVELLKDVARLEENIARLEAEKEAATNRLQRLQADFSNYRKRTDKEIGKVQATTIVGIIRELLPVIDNFERALAQEESEADFKKGVVMIYRQIMTFMEKQGVEVIEAVGEEFDHNYHNAVLQVESEEHESGIVVEEIQKGYILGDIVVRPAMVKVAE